MKITKRNGTISVFDDEKVIGSILKANAEVPQENMTEKIASGIAYDVFNRVTGEKELISTKEVRDCVYKVLLERGYPKTAELYANYKK